MRVDINGVFHEVSSPDLVFKKAFLLPMNYRPFRRGHRILARCVKCGEELGIYYCEDQLYAIKCPFCEVVSLVKANSPLQALQAVGEVYPAKEVE